MFHIGAGGWAYFHVPGMDNLAAYSRAFDYVEVNSTFYSTPSPATVRSWRKRVPDGFMFSVRCHRDLTHRHMLSPGKDSFDILDRHIRICNELDSEILLIQTPPTFDPGEKLDDIRELLSSFNFNNVRLAWEVRGSLSQKTAGLMQDLGIIHCTDISQEMPSVESEILYTRLFGNGIHNIYQFDDSGILQINTKARGFRKAYLTFHGVKMYSDAARLKIYRKSGKFPGVTKFTGMDSLKSVLGEDTQFPVTKNELLEGQGWKVFDLTEDEHIHAGTVLAKLPDRRYGSIDEIIQALQFS